MHIELAMDAKKRGKTKILVKQGKKLVDAQAHPAKMDFRKKLDPKHWSVQTMIFEA